MPTCPQCNAPLPPDAPAGLCPSCLLKRGLEPNTVPEISTLQSPISNPKSSSWTPPTPEQLAPFFPDLDTLSLLGRGGMGAVYKARQKSLDRIIALKILPPEISHDPNFAQRFTHEAQALARLNHPHIVTIYDYGTRSGQWPVVSGPTSSPLSTQNLALSTQNLALSTVYFLSMEYIDGLSLRQLLDAHTLTPNDALAIVPQICDALQYAHDRGIVHRDIKPENILLTKTGQIKIADFGLAKLIDPTSSEISNLKSPQRESVAGTPQYMSPEQSSSPDSVDHRADIYALGVVFYQMLTGELPPTPPNPLTAPSTKVHIDVRLDQIVLRALQQNPEARYQNATQFKTEIETVLNTPPLPEISNLKSSSTASIPPGTHTAPPPMPASSPSPLPSAISNLQIPATLLRIAAVINLLLLLMVLLFIAFAKLLHAVPSARVTSIPSTNIGLSLVFPIGIVVLGSLILNIFILRAAANMTRLRNHTQAVVACILSIIVFPANLIGLIGGIWSLIVLFQPETRAAFNGLPQPTPQSPPSATARASVPPSTTAVSQPHSTPRVSRLAVLGAIWAPFAFLVLLFFVQSTESEGGPGQTLTLLGQICAFTLIPLAVLAPFGTTICGIISLSQIRRSNGQLYGRPLALFDALLFPLLALDALLAYLIFNIGIAFFGWTHDYNDIHNSQLIVVTLLVSAVIDTAIILLAWRAIRPSPPPPRGGYNAPSPAHTTAPLAANPAPNNYTSTVTFLGLPLLHIANGIDPITRKMRTAHGIIAIGPRARGFIAIGGLAYGFIAIGGLAAGIFTMGGLSVGLIAIGGLALGLVSPSAGLGAGALYAKAGLAIAPHALGGTAIGRDITAGLPIYIQSQTGIILLATSIIFLLAASLAAMQKLCPIPANSPTPFRGTRKILVAIAAFLITLFLLLGLFPQTLFPTQPAAADIHYRVFEAPAELVDRLIPPTSRQSAELPDPDATPKSDFTGSPFTASTQTVEVPKTIVTSILRQAQEFTLGILVERERHVDFWPRVADSWSYSTADPKFFGSSGGNLFLGVRNEHHQLQLRVEGTLFHSLNTAIGVQSYIMWYGNAPTQNSARLFLTPFTRKNGEAEYVIVDYQLSDSLPVPLGAQLVPASRSFQPEDRFHPHIVPLAGSSELSVAPQEFTHTLPSGITVELIGLSQSPSDHAPWWRPDGSRLPTRPYDHMKGSMAPYPHALPRELLVHLTHLPPEPVDTLWQFDPPVSYGDSGPVLIAGQNRNDLIAVAALLPENSVTVRVGIASGPWHAVTSDVPVAGSVMGVDKGSVMFSPAIEKDGNTQVSIAYGGIEGNIRLLALDVEGHEHIAIQSSGGTARGLSQLNATIPNLPLATISAFRLQSRPVEWAEFKNVATKPVP